MADKALRGYSTCCLDASVVAKLLTREKDSQHAAELFRQLAANQTRVVEPAFLKVEVYSTLRKKCFLEEITLQKAALALKSFHQLPLIYAEEDKPLLNSAFRLADRLGMTVIYDCLYLALAQRERAVLITADRKFLQKAQSIYSASFPLAAP